jgi:hypothetical protein
MVDLLGIMAALAPIWPAVAAVVRLVTEGKRSKEVRASARIECRALRIAIDYAAKPCLPLVSRPRRKRRLR